MDLLYFSIPAFVIGLLFGSFMNVCLSRWPAGESIIKPGSHCRSCGHVLSWWENIPLLSWIFLRGRCRKCKAAIGWRYPAVELLCGVLFWITIIQFYGHTGYALPMEFYTWNFNSNLANYFLMDSMFNLYFLWTLVALLFMDAEHYWLPDRITIPALSIGLFQNLISPYMVVTVFDKFFPVGYYSRFVSHTRFGYFTDFVYSLATAIAAAALILLIRWIYFLFRKQEGMGLGDAKLMAMLGAWLGWQRTLLSFVLGIFLAAAFALILLFRGNPDEHDDSTKPQWALKQLPFGSFLCIAGLVSYFFGGKLIALYLSAVGF